MCLSQIGDVVHFVLICVLRKAEYRTKICTIKYIKPTPPPQPWWPYSFAVILLRNRVSWLLYFKCVCWRVAICVMCLFSAVQLVGLWSVIVVFPAHTHMLSDLETIISYCICLIIPGSQNKLDFVLSVTLKRITTQYEVYLPGRKSF